MGSNQYAVSVVLFTTLYFHKFQEKCVIHENLIHELQYLWWNLAIATKKEVCEILNVNYLLAANSWK